MLVEQGGQTVTIIDVCSVNREDYITFFEAGLGRGTAGNDAGLPVTLVGWDDICATRYAAMTVATHSRW